MVVCDTHALLFWASQPERLPQTAASVLEAERENGNLACPDIVLWEIAMLAAKQRIVIPVSPADYIRDILLALRLRVLPITPEIAEMSQSGLFQHGDPADRLIAATAMHHRAPLVSGNEELAAIPGLQIIW
jgi:PIN domain nuclease of toxin-antitoxin system